MIFQYPSRPAIFIIFCFAASIFFNSPAFSQQRSPLNQSGPRYKINWIPVVKSGDKPVITFENAHYSDDENRLPRFRVTVPGNNSQVRLVSVNTIPATREEISLLPKITNSEFLTETLNVTERKVISTLVDIFPFRKNPVSGQIEKLTAFDLDVTGSANRSSILSAQSTQPSTSVLATGDWYKFSVSSDGIYKITFDMLRQAGVETSLLTLQNLRLFGNGGGMVPIVNGLPRRDDLHENAIEVVDADNNGLFNNGDYFLFYGQGPDRWYYSSTERLYNHEKHYFSDSTFYFFTYNAGGLPERISLASSLTPSPSDRVITEFRDYTFYELDKYNFIKSGREWYGEVFDINLNQRFSFTFPNLVTGPVYLRSSVAARTSTTAFGASSRFTVSYNGTQILNQQITSVGIIYTDPFGKSVENGTWFNATGSTIDLDYTFIPYNSTSSGWLDFIALNAKRHLTFSNNQLIFRDRDTLNAISQTRYIISNAKPGLILWDITDPTSAFRQEYFLNSGQIEFVTSLPALESREYILFDNAAFRTPVFSRKIENQNLHALPFADLIIVTHPEFINAAEELASFRRSNDNLTVNVVTTDQVYNEFSSGAQDIAGIRDFVKMFYDRATQPADFPKYLLLLGDGSYDMKKRNAINTNYIPTFQSANSLAVIPSYTSDDFYGMMDANEGSLAGAEFIDIGVGRLPVQSAIEAQEIIKKIITYSTPGTITDESYCAGANTTRLGDWRNVLCFIADDQDGNLHLRQSERILNAVNSAHPVYNIDKIALDAYSQVSTPGGQRYPEVNDAIEKRIAKGAFVMNYTGHGGELGWAGEAVLNVDMIRGWNNSNALPAFITSTCEFSRYDDPMRTSAGEYVLLNRNGGGICLFTTVRLAFAHENEAINKSLLQYMLEPVNGSMLRTGDIQRLAKRDNPTNRNVTLLGDPSLKLAYPQYNVQTTSIEESGTGIVTDTISALSRVTVKGKVTDDSGNLITGFNGVVYPAIYDKSTMIKTLVNDATGIDVSKPDSFLIRKNILYKGKASVVNGEFSCSFIVPRDIAYQYGPGRLSYYAHNGTQDANGYDENFIIGGTSPNGIQDADGPQISLYMNDEKFVFGGLTDESPNVFAILFDSSGINTVGNGIGHDITAIIDGEPQKLYVLNDYYESDLNSFQKGRVVYPIENLSEGRHTLTFKAWDINNNSAEAYTEFVVSSSASLALKHVLNYPNPFTTHTTFFFEHNKPCTGMNIQVQVYTVSGKLVKTLEGYEVCDGFRNTSIEWDGLDDFGDRLGRGVYIYRLKIKTDDGASADKLERLVILR